MLKEIRNVRNLGAYVVDRLELYSQLIGVESRIASRLLARRVLWLAGGALFASLTVAMLHVAVIAHWWDSPRRLVAILLLAVVDAAIAYAAVRAATPSADKVPFDATRRELNSDIAYMKESM